MEKVGNITKMSYGFSRCKDGFVAQYVFIWAKDTDITLNVDNHNKWIKEMKDKYGETPPKGANTLLKIDITDRRYTSSSMTRYY